MEEVILRPEEVEIAALVAKMRMKENEKNQIADMLATNRDALENTTQSMAAELAACKFLNVFPSLEWFTDAIGQVDLTFEGLRVDVKWVPPRGRYVHARANGRQYDVILAVQGKAPRFWIVGWSWKWEIEQGPYYIDDRKHRGKVMPAHFKVPLAHMADVRSLRVAAASAEQAREER